MISPLVFPTFPFLRQLPQALYRYLLFCLYQLLLRFRNLVFAELLFFNSYIYHFFYFDFYSYPLILSLENHCDIEQQTKMAFHLKNILGGISCFICIKFFLLFFTQKQRPILSYFYIRNEIYFTDFILSQYCPSFVCSVPKKD